MDIRSLEVFLALSEELHFGKTAARLSMSQSSVSEHLRRLEERLGRSLFDRTSRRVTLTETGEILAHRVRDPVKAIRIAMREAERGENKSGETLRIGFLGGGFYELYQPFAHACQREHPNLALKFIELSYETQFSAVVHDEVDMAFCRLPVGLAGLECGPIVMSDPRVVCVNLEHRLAMFDHIDAEELGGETMLRVPATRTGTVWSEYHFPLKTPAGIPLKPGPMIRTVREGIAAAVAGHGVFFLTKRAAQYFATPRLAFVEINLPPIQSAFVWRRGDSRSSVYALNQMLIQIARKAKIS